MRWLRVRTATVVLRYADRIRNAFVGWAIPQIADYANEAERTAVVEERLRSPSRQLALVVLPTQDADVRVIPPEATQIPPGEIQ